MRTREHRIELRLNDREFARLDNAAKKSGIGFAPYLRNLIKGMIPQDVPPPEYGYVLKELRAIGRNINQIALVANATGIVDAKIFEERYSELIKLTLDLIKAAELPREVL